MRLNIWLEKKKVSRANFAKMLNMTERGVSMWINGERIPTRENMLEIIEATGGQVKPNDFYK